MYVRGNRTHFLSLTRLEFTLVLIENSHRKSRKFAPDRVNRVCSTYRIKKDLIVILTIYISNSSSRTGEMIVVESQNYAELIRLLEAYFPSSLSVYHLVREKVLKRFEWPDVSFVVDSFPDFSVCIARASFSSNQEVPFINDAGICVFSKNPEKLQQLLDNPECIDWSRRLFFRGLTYPTDVRLVLDKASNLGMHQTFFSPGVCIKFSLANITPAYSLPDAFRLGTLREEHAEQLAAEIPHGTPPNIPNLTRFFRYIIKHYPSAAIFHEDSAAPVAYISYRSEGCLGFGYTVPAHRGKCLFRIVCCELLRKFRELGDKNAYAYVSPDNHASLNVMKSLGGQVLENYQALWVEFAPPNLLTNIGEIKLGTR